MKSIRLRGRPDPERAPALFSLIADSPHVEEARLVGWNLAEPAGATLAFAVAGDRDRFEAALPDGPTVDQAETAAVGTDRFLFLLRAAPPEESLLGTMLEAVAREGLVVVKPVVYRDGAVDVRLVGTAEAVQGFVDGLPSGVTLDVTEVGTAGADPTAGAPALPDRQREAVLAALELGYYDSPRAATHEDVARALDCAESTASEHLQKAEAALIRQAMGGAGRGR